MYRKSNKYLVLFAVMALVCMAAGIATATTVTNSITYQGKLTNAAGTPLTGTYSVTFKLYDTSTGGTALSTDTHSVTATNGLFTTTVTADPQLPDGRALWLGIKVGSDPEMTPRQEIRPVPYALGLRPGAVMNVTGSKMALYLLKYDDTYGGLYVDTYGKSNAGVRSIVNGRSSSAFSAETLNVFDTGYQAVVHYADSDGVSVRTESGSSTGYRATILGDNSAGVSVNSSGSHSPGVDVHTSKEASYGVSVNTTGYGSEAVRAYTSGEKSGALYGNSARDIGVYGFGKAGGVYGESPEASGIYGRSTNASGVKGHSTDAEGVLGESVSGYGVIGYSPNNIGVRGEGATYGVWARSIPGTGVYGASDTGYGIHGDSVSNYGVVGESQTGYGVKGSSSSTVGVYGSSISGAGVYGIGKEGGYFTTNKAGTFWPGFGGVDVYTIYNNNPGVRIDTTGNYSDGVYAYSTGFSSSGVRARASGPFSQGVYAYSVQSNGVDAYTGNANHQWGVYTDDYIYAGGIRAPDVDLAEFMPVTEDLSPGTILIIGPEGKLQISTTANDTRVAGIISTSPAIALGTKPEGNSGEAIVAISGRVPCKVDATKAPIHAGDLLTTSDNPGYAMKAKPIEVNGQTFYPSGIVLGKAMGTLESGTGTIEVLVTLQ